MSWIATPQSSNIAGFDYDPNTQVLTVGFKHGDRYQYYSVPQSIFEGMKTASSKGEFLAQNIKNVYRYAKV